VGQIGYVDSKFLQKREQSGFVSRMSAELSFVDQTIAVCDAKCLSPLYSEQKINVCFINMDHSETVDAMDASVFEDHSVDNLLPSCQNVPYL
jgi:hypothetical protein